MARRRPRQPLDGGSVSNLLERVGGGRRERTVVQRRAKSLAVLYSYHTTSPRHPGLRTRPNILVHAERPLYDVCRRSSPPPSLSWFRREWLDACRPSALSDPALAYVRDDDGPHEAVICVERAVAHGARWETLGRMGHPEQTFWSAGLRCQRVDEAASPRAQETSATASARTTRARTRTLLVLWSAGRQHSPCLGLLVLSAAVAYLADL
ncbi:hypothetical protein DFH06DRAFT_753468 [Mycena polygramma]|nr:hypothetical protein DFH06DRAFT_753468 [Mycena polygramma]